MIRKTALVAFVALLAVGMSVGAMGAAPMAQDTTEEGQETTTEAEEMDEEDEEDAEDGADADNETAAENSTVTFDNQTSDGVTVVVNETTMPEGGFIAIHLADNVTAASFNDLENVSIGPVIGNSSYLEAGTHENVTVELNETIDESQPLIAMNHQDTNDNQVYDFPEADGPYTIDMFPVIDLGNVTVEGGEAADAAEETTTEGGEELGEGDEEETTEDDGEETTTEM